MPPACPILPLSSCSSHFPPSLIPPCTPACTSTSPFFLQCGAFVLLLCSIWQGTPHPTPTPTPVWTEGESDRLWAPDWSNGNAQKRRGLGEGIWATNKLCQHLKTVVLIPFSLLIFRFSHLKAKKKSRITLHGHNLCHWCTLLWIKETQIKYHVHFKWAQKAPSQRQEINNHYLWR